MKSNLMKKFLVCSAAVLMASVWVLAEGPADAPAEHGKWRVSGGVRYAPGVKSRGSLDSGTALDRMGVQPSRSVRKSLPGDVKSRAEAEASSGYNDSGRYDFDNGYIDMNDGAGIPGQTTNWRFDDTSAFDGANATITGEKRYGSVTRETTVTAEGAGVLSGSSDEDGLGFYLQAERELWASGRFGLGLSLGYAFYRDIDGFEFSGPVGRRVETIKTTEEGGVVRTSFLQPDLDSDSLEDLLADPNDPTGPIGGGSPDIEGSISGYLPILNVTAGDIATSTVEEAPRHSTSHRAGGASSYSASVSSEISLQEFRLGLTPWCQLCDRVRLVGGLGALVSYSELEVKTSLFSNGARIYSDSSTEDDWDVSCYVGLSVAVELTDWLELSVGAEGVFPSRNIHYDDGLVRGEAELSDWGAHAGVAVVF